jgi:phospholipid/cholesterol/gamma-HCH transport system permease protein
MLAASSAIKDPKTGKETDAVLAGAEGETRPEAIDVPPEGSARRVNFPGWRASWGDARLVLSLSGNWTMRNAGSHARTARGLPQFSGVGVMGFDSSELGTWDSSLLVFLSSLREIATQRQIEFDQSGLPAAAQRLLALLPVQAQAPAVAQRRMRVVEEVGEWAIGKWSGAIALATLVGEAAMRAIPGLRGKVRARAGDLRAFIYGASAAALPMAALVNILVGAIVAFVGGIQLRRLGAEIFVGNLIGVTEVREMAPLITAIVMSGRTGSAYAAEIAAMQGSEELEALRALGIPIFDYLVLPRLLALTTMMPLLCAYAGALGILGGFSIAVFILHLTAGSFLAHLHAAVAGTDILLGLAKSIAFGSWIAIAACRIGLSAGRAATDVGRAATTAAVSGIVGVIALDALFDVCAEVFGI